MIMRLTFQRKRQDWRQLHGAQGGNYFGATKHGLERDALRKDRGRRESWLPPK
jgi:hypothetical protein